MPLECILGIQQDSIGVHYQLSYRYLANDTSPHLLKNVYLMFWAFVLFGY
jgi:hypothetical protein